MNMTQNFKHENKIYTVAVVHLKRGPFALDLPLMTMEKAEKVAKHMNDNYMTLIKPLGEHCVAYNTTAKTMDPPYKIDMEEEWNYVLDAHNESLYTSLNTNTHAEGSI
jgi:hypothetical protein